MKYLEKEAGLKEILLSGPARILGGLHYMSGLGGGALKLGLPVAATAAVGGPLLAGYLLGKSRKRLKDAGTPEPEVLEREILKRKYDEKIREIAERRGLFPEEINE